MCAALVAGGLGLLGQTPDARALITAAYSRADAAYVGARSVADLEAIRGWLDTTDCVYADFGQRPRPWLDMRAYAERGLETRLGWRFVARTR